MTDSELGQVLKLVRDGDMQAFESMYNDLKTPLFTIIRRTGCDYHQAEDVLQDLFVKLYNSLREKIPDRPLAYIFTSAKNLAIDAVRVQRRFCNSDELESVHVQPSCDSRLDFEAALCSLEVTVRHIVSLHLNAGFKFAEIAKIMKMPLGTVLWKYRRAIVFLRDKMKEK